MAQPHDPEAAKMMGAYRDYLDMALRSHSSDLNHLSKANADEVCLTSSIHRIGAFAIFQERQLVPYAPPTNLLQISNGAERVFEATWEWTKDDEPSIAMHMIKRPPVLPPIFNGGEPIFGEDKRQGLLHLLRRSPTENLTEPWSADVYEAYASTISYIGSVQVAIADGEEPADVCRRLVAFPMLIQKQFIDLVHDGQPRALVVLAHYFALLARFRNVWWVGSSGQREVRGIQSVLSDEWQGLLAWPLATMEADSFYLRTISTSTVLT